MLKICADLKGVRKLSNWAIKRGTRATKLKKDVMYKALREKPKGKVSSATILVSKRDSFRATFCVIVYRVKCLSHNFHIEC